jgi:hypothetical protein
VKLITSGIVLLINFFLVSKINEKKKILQPWSKISNVENEEKKRPANLKKSQNLIKVK